MAGDTLLGRLLLVVIFFGLPFGSASAQTNRLQALVDGYELIDLLQGPSPGSIFGRGYLMAAVESTSLCPPASMNAFGIRDAMLAELVARPDAELKLPAALIAPYPFYDAWSCGEAGGQDDHYSLRSLMQDLTGTTAGREAARGYIAATIDYLAAIGSLRCKVHAAAIDDYVDAVQSGLQMRLEFADNTAPAVAKARPSAVIVASIREADLCE